MTVPSNPLFEFNGGVYAVRVENVPQSVSRQEIVELFTTLIGEVRNCDEYFEEGKRRMFEVAFANPDTTKKALCMSGYTVAGVPLVVSASCHIKGQRVSKQNKQLDMRRNLYVLGLPFDLTKSEFVEIFSRYGRVVHAVILATVDNASRRRGFVVMSCHKEARFAMEALGRTEIKGHTIDVSWAVVQRSQGFLDGGDRTMVLSNSNSASGSPGFDSDSWDASPPASVGLATPPLEVQNQVLLPTCSPTLLVTNLPSAFFSQPADLQPLLCPFGDVKHLRIVTDNPAAGQGNISVIVEYKTLAQAQDARDNLSGQFYANQPVQVEFIVPKTTTCLDADSSVWSPAKGDLKAGLNPYAPPFLGPRVSQDGPMATFSSCYGGPVLNICEEGGGPSAASVVNPSFVSLPAFHSPVPPSSGLCVPQLDLLRPHSAPSRPFNGNNEIRPGHWTCSSSQALPTLSSTSVRSPFIA